MFWSLVRPDKILLPITRSAAVTASLEADELAVGMITCEMSKGQDSWSSTSDQTLGVGPSGTAGRFIGLLWAGGGSKKRRCPSAERGGGLALQPILFSKTVACKNATSLTPRPGSVPFSYSLRGVSRPTAFSGGAPGADLPKAAGSSSAEHRGRQSCFLCWPAA